MIFDEIELSGEAEVYEFSKEAYRKIGKLIGREDFQEMNSSQILHFLIKEMQVIPFSDYLKRYIYLEVKPEESFREVTDEFYIQILLNCFKENHVPFHIGDNTTSPRRTVSRWLTQTTVAREVVFLLGFALRMETEIVSEFLQKVLQEEDFDFDDPIEVIYWYCYEHQMPYAYAVELQQEYVRPPYENADKVQEKHAGVSSEKAVKMQPKFTTTRKTDSAISWKKQIRSLEYRIHPERTLKNFLKSMQGKEQKDYTMVPAYLTFKMLYNEVRARIAEIRMQESKGYLHSTIEDISPVDVEKELYAGVPRERGGNLRKASFSILSDYMNCHYLSRQRIEKLISGKYPVRRYDIINLCFCLHSTNKENQYTSKQRFLGFIEDTNQKLQDSLMSPLHPSHPSEGFLMICMMSEMPMITYSDILELSFERNMSVT